MKNRSLARAVRELTTTPEFKAALKEAGEIGCQSTIAVSRVYDWLQTSIWWRRLDKDSQKLIHDMADFFEAWPDLTDSQKNNAAFALRVKTLRTLGTIASAYLIMGVLVGVQMDITKRDGNMAEQ